MAVTGIVTIQSGESRISGTLIEVQGAGDPIRAATDLLASRGIQNGNCATLSGGSGRDGSTSVFFVTAAAKAAMAACQSAESFTARAMRSKRTARKKVAKTKKKKSGSVAKKKIAKKKSAAARRK